jgi:hypothetical protein
MSYQSQREFNNWVEVTSPEFSASSVQITGYSKNLDSKCHGFTNYATFKIIQSIMDYPEFRDYVRECDKMRRGEKYDETIVNSTLEFSVNDTLAGVHFNTPDELKAYIGKNYASYWLLPEEYEKINWKEVWTQLGHKDDFFGEELTVDYGLTGSYKEQLLKDNPDYYDMLDKLNTSAQSVKPNERKEFVLENAVIIIKGLLHRIKDLKRCPQAVDAIAENKASLKQAVKSLIQTFGKIPTTYDSEVDFFLYKMAKASNLKFA